MKRLFLLFFIFTSFTLLNTSCSSGDDDDDNPLSSGDANFTTEGCTNVVIFNGYAYGACGDQIEIVNLENGSRNAIPVAADDIAIDASTQNLFVQSRTLLQALSLTDPFAPNLIASTQTNFAIFSGVGAANGVVVVSAGSRTSDTQVYNFNTGDFNLINNGITEVDRVTGNPDVHVVETANGIRAFYSQDLGLVTNWGIQIVDFNADGTVLNIPNVIELASQQFTGGFSLIAPANFPLESEFLNNRLYVAHFAVNGIQVVDLNNDNAISSINLGYQPINIATDGTLLFTVGTTSNVVSILNPNTNALSRLTVNAIRQARGVAVNSEYIVIADLQEGLIVLDR
jgi:hypothetical protein